ncbi:hypothetical protein ACKLNR_000601 [Fusarium oxysporum f. sp. zingiberi]
MRARQERYQLLVLLNAPTKSRQPCQSSPTAHYYLELHAPSNTAFGSTILLSTAAPLTRYRASLLDRHGQTHAFSQFHWAATNIPGRHARECHPNDQSRSYALCPKASPKALDQLNLKRRFQPAHRLSQCALALQATAFLRLANPIGLGPRQQIKHGRDGASIQAKPYHGFVTKETLPIEL